MVKLVFCCRRRPDLSQEDFRRYWLENHGPLVRSARDAMPGMVRYLQSHTLDTTANEALRASRGSGEPYDGIALDEVRRARTRYPHLVFADR